MNVHYEELLEFLTKLIDTPSLLFDAEEKVFKTEPMLYSNDHSLNHRLTPSYIPVRNMLYQKPHDSRVLHTMVQVASKAMSE